ncbi:hypothetical protein EMPG_14986 [Blastomyces silverae]|uniref:Uncharacterized protein n=1 Tax=Blastomyces silverae TaxID=2060906 RepID=A0A0H1BEM5_9EURO|nr:hypothetical protein EMPG_14986 [Blastomyces silverae]
MSPYIHESEPSQASTQVPESIIQPVFIIKPPLEIQRGVNVQWPIVLRFDTRTAAGNPAGRRVRHIETRLDVKNEGQSREPAIETFTSNSFTNIPNSDPENDLRCYYWVVFRDVKFDMVGKFAVHASAHFTFENDDDFLDIWSEDVAVSVSDEGTVQKWLKNESDRMGFSFLEKTIRGERGREWYGELGITFGEWFLARQGDGSNTGHD